MAIERDNYSSCRAQITGNAARNSRVCTRVTRYNLRCGVHNRKQNPGWAERMALVRLAATVFYQQASHTGTTAIHVSNLSSTIFREILTRLRVFVDVVVSSGATCETIDVSCIIHRGSPFDPRPVLRFPCFQISSQFQFDRLRKNFKNKLDKIKIKCIINVSLIIFLQLMFEYLTVIIL